jgi:hypothetical protein
MRPVLRAALIAAGIANAAPAAATTFTVTDPGNAGANTLRQAILDANANVNVVDTIAFNLPGPVFTIQPTAPLPQITDPVIIDGYTQPGTSPNSQPTNSGLDTVLVVEINGAMAGDTDGFLVEHLTNLGAGTTIRGLIINGFNNNLRAAIRINDDGNNTIEGNFIGTDRTGLQARPNSDGVSIEFLAADNQIGGQTPAARNLISGNSNRGVVLDTNDNTIEGNLVGTDRSGLAALPNGAGIVLFNFAADNVIGGSPGIFSPAANTISGNGNAGIIIGTNSNGHDIIANNIGLAVNGVGLLGNGPGTGIQVGGTGVTITDNNIAGNATGISVSAVSNTTIQRNLIGLPGLANAGTAISIFDGTNNLIGGPSPADGNRIAGNGAGVQVVRFMTAADGNAILMNQIYANGGPGIELVNGANNAQPAPHLTGASGATLVQGSLLGAPSTNYRLEFFANSRCATNDGGQGEIPIGAVNAATGPGGQLQFDVAVGSFPGLAIITATATDPANNTSQFSNCVLNRDALARPVPALGGAALAAGLLLLLPIARRTLRQRG